MNKDTKETLVVFMISAVIGAAFMFASLHKIELHFSGKLSLTGSVDK